MADLNTDVRYIRGIGETKAKALGKLGIFTLGDLIGWFPRRYEDRRKTRPISSLIPGETACVAAMIASEPKVSHIRKGMDLVKVRAVDDTGALDVTFFNQSWLKNQLRVGETYIFYGRAEGSLLRKAMAGPVVEPEGRREFTGRIVPVYPLTAGVSQLLLSRAIRQGLDECADILPDCLPDSVRQTHGLCRVNYAYENIHFPESPEALDIARRRLAFEELFFFAIGLKLLRSRRETVSVEPFRPVDMAPFYDALPFILTGAQRRCVDEAIADMTAGKPMNRLCQGDVGNVNPWRRILQSFDHLMQRGQEWRRDAQKKRVPPGISSSCFHFVGTAFAPAPPCPGDGQGRGHGPAAPQRRSGPRSKGGYRSRCLPPAAPAGRAAEGRRSRRGRGAAGPPRQF